MTRECFCDCLTLICSLNFVENKSHITGIPVQQILLEQPCLVSVHFCLATSITCPNQNEAEDIGLLKHTFHFKIMLFILI